MIGYEEVAERTQQANAQLAQYQQQAQLAAQAAVASLFAEPEFSGLRADQIGTAFQIIARDNPQRAAQIAAKAQAADQIIAQHNQITPRDLRRTQIKNPGQELKN